MEFCGTSKLHNPSTSGEAIKFTFVINGPPGGMCMDTRGLTSEDMLQGVQKSTMDELADWIFWADKVIVFYNEDGMEIIPQLVPIGVIHSPFTTVERTPIQPIYSENAEGTLEIFPEFGEGLSDLNGFERIWLIYLFDRASPPKLKIVPFRDNVERGVFATRAPSRPNPIGLSVVRLLGVDGLMLRVADLDILDGTPLLDIKPYISQVDSHPDSRAGWWGARTVDRKNADGRFENE